MRLRRLLRTNPRVEAFEEEGKSHTSKDAEDTCQDEPRSE
jgi:hypothetical protein